MKAKTQRQIEKQDIVISHLLGEAPRKVLLDSRAQVEDDGLILKVAGQTVRVELCFDGPRTLKHVFRVIVSDDNWTQCEFERVVWENVESRAKFQNRLDAQ